MFPFSNSTGTEHFGGKVLFSNALGHVVHAHNLFFSFQYQTWQHQAANSSVHHQLEETNALQYTAQYSYGQPHDNDLNDHKSGFFIIQNFFKKQRNYLVDLLVSKLFRILLRWKSLEVLVKFVLFICKPK